MNLPSTSLRKYYSRFRRWFKNREKEKQLIEYVVDTVDPKIKLSSGYRKQLRRPLQICLAHCASIVEKIPGPIYLKDSDYDSDPLIHAVFLGSKKLEDLIKHQDVVLKPAESERYALLSMTHRESTIFGPKIDGDMILGDAKMKSVTFTDHKIVGLSTTLKDSKEKLEEFCFQMILEAISRELAAKRTDLVELREHLARLNAMSEIFSGESQSVFGHSSKNDLEKLNKVERLLKESEEELVLVQQGNETPEDWLKNLSNLLIFPEKIMHVQRISMRLDWRNVFTEGSEEKASEIILAQCSLTDEIKRDAVFITYKNKVEIDL